MLVFDVSFTVTDWLPEVLSVTVNVPVPPVIKVSLGSTAWPSLLVKCTVFE
jgi:hypothetical protein